VAQAFFTDDPFETFPPEGVRPPLGDEERERVLYEWNRTRVEYPRDSCVHELFAARAAGAPEAEAVAGGDLRLSYGELDARAGRLADYLRAEGVGPETIVGLLMERSVEMVALRYPQGGRCLPISRSRLPARAS
jgi:non-ribosomal peptide synthetase component F